MAEALDLRTQVRVGPSFTLIPAAGGTGREDAYARGIVYPAAAKSDTGAITKGQVVTRTGNEDVGPAITVKPTTVATDRPIGVALEAIAVQEVGDIAYTGAPVLILTDGNVAVGDVLYTSGVAGRATATKVDGATAIGISLSAASGTDDVWAILVMMSVPALDFSQFRGSVIYIIGDGTNAITTGQKGHIRWPFAGTLLRASLLADASGSIVIDIWKDTYANFPPTVADTITAAAKPTLASAQKSEDTTLTGWTKTFAEGDIYAFNVDSAATVKRVALELKWQRT